MSCGWMSMSSAAALPVMTGSGGSPQATGEASLVAQGADVPDTEGPLADGLGDGAGHLCLAV